MAEPALIPESTMERLYEDWLGFDLRIGTPAGVIHATLTYVGSDCISLEHDDGMLTYVPKAQVAWVSCTDPFG